MATYSAAATVPAIDRDVPLSLFGGANTEISPPDLPEGGSPDSEDVVFVPGGVSTRPGLHGILNSLTTYPIVYCKTYVQPNGVPINLFLDTSGALYVEYPLSAPGVRTLLRQGIPNLFGQSVTAFGREYLAFSDGSVGYDIPLQFDGTNLDRVTQDGPGAPPTVGLTMPVAQSLVAQGGSTGTPVTITFAQGSGRIVVSGQLFWTTIIYDTASPHGFTANELVDIEGNSDPGANVGLWPVQAVNSPTRFTVGGLNLNYQVSGSGGTAMPPGVSGYILSRTNNTVTAVTAGPTSVQVGNQVQIGGVANTVIGGTISSAVRVNGISTITTSANHNLFPQNTVIVGGVTDSTFDGTIQVYQVLSPTIFTYFNPAADSTSSGGTVSDIWNGTFPVTAVISSTSFQYMNAGPNDLATGTGTAIQFGQLSPGVHQVVQIFRTRQGALTAPSPPVSFTANGGTSAIISNLAIGPPNVTERILAFTGSGGDNFFYIGVPAVVSGVVQSTSTVVNDNSSTSVLVDFSDNTLFAATAIDIPGNNLFAQVVLGPCLGFGAYASRLMAWGERNKIQNFLNMGFDGGYTVTDQPLGWTIVNSGHLVTGDSGWAWQLPGNTSGTGGMIQQSAYQDWTGTAIVQPNAQYTLRCFLSSSNANDSGYFVAGLQSASLGFAATANIALPAVGTSGNFFQANFNLPMPATIPSDMVLTIYTQNQPTGHHTNVDELEIIPAASPYLNNIARASYVNNPEGFDGVTGTFGPADDPSPMQCMTLIRNSLILHTANGTASTIDNDAEPSGWVVNNISREVGALSFRSCDPSPTGTGDAGEEWEVVATRAGLYVFSGGDFYKISQEYQNVWDTINWNARQAVWVKNDTSTRIVSVGVPLGSSLTVNAILTMGYRDLDTGTQIGTTPAVRISFTGRMIATDVSRKWTKWNIVGQCGQILQRPNGPEMCVGALNGQLYYFDSAKYSDDDYGQIFSYWTSYFFVNHDQEIALGVGAHEKLFAYLTLYVTGVGQIMAIPYGASLSNPLPATPLYPLKMTQPHDTEWPINVLTPRCAFKIAAAPLPGQTDAYFNLQKMVATIRQNAWFPVSGARV